MASGDKDRGSSRLLLRLEEAIYDKKFYEAHQLVRTINFRYQSCNKVPDLEALLIKTAIILLDAEQHESGTDVGIMLTKLYLEQKLAVEDNRIRSLIELVQKMHDSPERTTFIANVIEWSYGSTSLNGQFNYTVAKIYIKDSSYQEAWKHLIRMTDIQLMSDMMFQIVSKCSVRNDEIDLVVAILILSLLVEKRVSDAEFVFSASCPRVPAITPLVNALRFTIEACKKPEPIAYSSLKQIYWPSFNREPNVLRLFVSLGSIVFKIPKTGQSAGLMDNFFAALSQPDSPRVLPTGNETMALD